MQTQPRRLSTRPLLTFPTREVMTVPIRPPTRLSRVTAWITVTALFGFGMWAYTYSAPAADLGDTWLGTAFVQVIIRAAIVAQILRGFILRWDEFTPGQRFGWSLVALGMILNLARGNFGATPLTLSFALLHLGMFVLTWRLMAATRREKILARSLHESEQIRLQQDEVIADLQADIHRIGQQSKEFEIRARTAERRLRELEKL